MNNKEIIADKKLGSEYEMDMLEFNTSLVMGNNSFSISRRAIPIEINVIKKDSDMNCRTN
jgi:hypothetical protein